MFTQKTNEGLCIFKVVWNPWADQARELGDFGDDEYPNMLCVEAGHVSTPVILLPGTAFEASQILQVNFPQKTFPLCICLFVNLFLFEFSVDFVCFFSFVFVAFPLMCMIY